MSNLHNLVKKLYSASKNNTDTEIGEYGLVDYVAGSPNIDSMTSLAMAIARAPSKDASYTWAIRKGNVQIVCDKDNIDSVMKENFNTFNYKLFLIATEHNVPLINGFSYAKESNNVRSVFEDKSSETKKEDNIISGYLLSGKGDTLTISDVKIQLEGALAHIKKSGGKMFPKYSGDFSLIASSDLKYSDASHVSVYDALSACTVEGKELRDTLWNTMNKMQFVSYSFVGVNAGARGNIILKLERKNN